MIYVVVFSGESCHCARGRDGDDDVLKILSKIIGKEAVTLVILLKNVREQDFLRIYPRNLASIGNPRVSTKYVSQE